MTPVTAASNISQMKQYSLPNAVRTQLSNDTGDRMMLISDGENEYMKVEVLIAMERLQSAMAGAAQEAGVTNEEELFNMLTALRHESGKPMT